MIRAFAVVALLLPSLAIAQPVSPPPSTAKLELDQAWFQKLGQLCQAAVYANKMASEPICAELNQKADEAVRKAQVEEQAKKAKAEADAKAAEPAPPPETKKK